MTPDLTPHPLSRADGSATYSNPLFTILAAVNGPVEVSRRDELPEEAALEVNIRPSAGIGGPRERWLESILTALLKSVVLVHLHPRTLVQVSLQVTREPGAESGLKRRVLDRAVIPALVNAAFLALVDGGIPLEKTVVAGLACVMGDNEVVVEPSEKQLMGCGSVHAMAFSAKGELSLDESAGEFGIEQWGLVCKALRATALEATAEKGEDDVMTNGTVQSRPWLREALESEARRVGAWREGGG